MQTAIQQLIQRMNTAKERGDKKYKPAFEYWIHELERALPMEKQQIVDAFETGDCPNSFLHGEQYYNETFKQ